MWYQHVPREHNKWADWLTRVATYHLKDGCITDITKVTSEPPKEVAVDFIGIGEEMNDKILCTRCKKEIISEYPYTRCWGCVRVYHKLCAYPRGPLYPGPWHCKVCTITHK